MPVMDTINPGVLRFWEGYTLEPANGVDITDNTVYLSCLHDVCIYGEAVIDGAAGDAICTLPAACRPKGDQCILVPGDGWGAGETVADRSVRPVGVRVRADGSVHLDEPFTGGLAFSAAPYNISSRIYSVQSLVARAYVEQWAAGSGQTAIVQCVPYGLDGSSVTYQWQFSTNQGNTWSDSTASSGRTYRYVNNTPGRGVLYRCQVTSSDGRTATSNATTLRSD